MNNFHIKSVILGIGIGVILTSIVSMVYLAGTYPVKVLSDSEIILRAKQLGMVEESLLYSRNSEKEQDITDLKEETGDEVSEKNKSKDQSGYTDEALSQKDIKVEIEQGDTSEIVADKLVDSGLIAVREDFLNKLKDMKLESGINFGKFSFREGTDIETIIRTITIKK